MSYFLANNDIIDFDNGTMIIHRNNIGKYLIEYMCDSEDELKDSMWINYGIYVSVIN